MNEQNIERLTDRLIALGFDASVETQLRCQLCFSPSFVDLHHSLPCGEDLCQFVVRIEREINDQYQLKSYTALLRKKIELSAALLELDERMKKIDWVLIATGRKQAVSISNTAIQAGYQTLEALQSAGLAADLLRFKYWQGTSLEHLIVNVNEHRFAWEISDRFYFFNDLEVIHFNEAVRFLNSRWVERQMIARKKLIEKTTSTNGNNGKGLLLKKKPGRNMVNNLLKK